MNPDTVHLLAQLIRHSRGMLTAFENWLVKQPTEESQTDSPLASRIPRHAEHGLSDSTAPVAKGR